MEFSVIIDVVLCLCTNDYNVFLIGIAIKELWKTPPTSAYDADATTCRSVLHSTNTTPFLKQYIPFV